MARKEYRSMRGKIIDMDLLRKKNELTPAVGNVKVNARGDELGPGGKIIRKREDIVSDHYGSKTVRQSSGTLKKTNKTTEGKKIEITEKLTDVEQEMLDEIEAEDEWIEDDDGNFVKKGG